MSQYDTGDELTLLASAFSIAVAKDMSNEDINILACFFTAVGANLAVIAAARQAETKESDMGGQAIP